MIGLILCGGEGTRLRGVIPAGFPKTSVRIGGLPVLDYANLAARSAGCTEVCLLSRPGHGTVAEVGAVRTVRPLETLLVLNGDTLLFGELLVPEIAGLAAVLGQNRLTSAVEPAYYIVGPQAKLSGRNIEDNKPSLVFDEWPRLKFIDIGTPEGLAYALEDSKRWSS